MRTILLSILLTILVGISPGSARWLGGDEQDRSSDHPGTAAEHVRSAESLADHGECGAAMVHWRAAQQLAPEDASIANSLGGAFLRMGRAAESAAQFERAVRLDGANAAYHFNLANVEFMLRHDLAAAWKIDLPQILQQALAEFREASRLAPRRVEYARAYAETFYGVPGADWAEAEAAWKHVLSLSPEGRDFIYLQLARVSLKRGDAASTRQFLQQIATGPHDGLKRKMMAQAERL
ncbi:MAG: hypothetical protein ACR2G0_07395 [Chthoniobacterales bacterium]